MSPERDLWQAVLLIALNDAAGRARCTGTASARVAATAAAWIRNGGRDFRTVCCLAGFDPNFVRETYSKGNRNACQPANRRNR